jgi:hypothetical protein
VPENVYNINETGVMLSILSCVKVLVGKTTRATTEARALSEL